MAEVTVIPRRNSYVFAAREIEAGRNLIEERRVAQFRVQARELGLDGDAIWDYSVRRAVETTAMATVIAERTLATQRERVFAGLAPEPRWRARPTRSLGELEQALAAAIELAEARDLHRRWKRERARARRGEERQG